MSFSDLPTVNALLNASSAFLLLLGHRFINRGQIQAHRRCMIAAMGVSLLFLISYVTYHLQHGSTPFQGQGFIRPVYFSILISHTFLAVSVLPLSLITLRLGLKGAYDRHKRIARWTYPIWLYVSVTGVFVYLMLYHAYAP